ncbi:hypothetical protein C2E23DRAFT_938433 [Lenzites betulinus]|nr:hypothetical protein C2E23DRAFT_938433 [Lenzites betulinus]
MVNRSEDVPRLPVNESTHTHTSDDPGLSAKDPPDVIREHDRPTGNSGTKAKLEGRPDIPPQVTVNDVYRRKADVFTQEKKEEAWSSAATMVETYSDAMVKRWKEEIDTYLVFAGLFSAVLTTFNVQTYPLLRPAAPDPSIAMLQQISSQLASFSISNSFVNSTRLASTGRPNIIDPPPAPRWAVWLNALWLSSLVLSLSSASIGIMAKQWLNEYQSGVSGTSRPHQEKPPALIRCN